MQGKARFPNEIGVKVNGFRRYKGFLDLIETYCCSSASCYYVVFPEIRHATYFKNPETTIKSSSSWTKIMTT